MVYTNVEENLDRMLSNFVSCSPSVKRPCLNCRHHGWHGSHFLASFLSLIWLTACQSFEIVFCIVACLVFKKWSFTLCRIAATFCVFVDYANSRAIGPRIWPKQPLAEKPHLVEGFRKTHLRNIRLFTRLPWPAVTHNLNGV